MALEPPRRLVRALGETSPLPAPGRTTTGAEGTADPTADWLARLPQLAEQALAARELTLERVHLPGGRSSLVLLVRRADGTPAVLKLAPPRARPEAERAALAHWNGLGAVRLYDEGAPYDEGADTGARPGPDAGSGPGPNAGANTGAHAGATTRPSAGANSSGSANAGAGTGAGTAPRAPQTAPGTPQPAGAKPPSGALLLERLRPDVSVRTLPEAKSMLEAAGTLRRLWVEPPAGHRFESVAARTGRQGEAMRADAAADPLVAPLVEAALAAREELLAAPPEERLLHGTFRQSKVLAADRAPWLAVGPDPVVGECAFDLARLVRDRVEDVIAAPSGPAVTRRRVKRLAESLDVDQERLRGWTLFRAVESGVRARRVGRLQDGELLLEFAGWL